VETYRITFQCGCKDNLERRSILVLPRGRNIQSIPHTSRFMRSSATISWSMTHSSNAASIFSDTTYPRGAISENPQTSLRVIEYKCRTIIRCFNPLPSTVSMIIQYLALVVGCDLFRALTCNVSTSTESRVGDSGLYRIFPAHLSRQYIICVHGDEGIKAFCLLCQFSSLGSTS